MDNEETKSGQDRHDITKTLKSIKDPKLKNTFARLWENIEKSEYDGTLEKIKKTIGQPIPDPEQLVFSFLPHQLAKTSIFFPMSDKELKEENRKIDKIEQKTNWGIIIIEGIRLAIIEEDVLLAILKIAREKLRLIDGKYILEIKMKEIIHLLYGTSSYSTKKVTALIIRTLNHFQLVRFEIDLYKKIDGKKEIGSINSIGNIVQSHHYDSATDYLAIVFNPEFCKLFLESMLLTNINFTLRRQLKRDGSKALLRFLSTHTEPGNMHISTVLNAINYNTNQPTYELRRKFKQFLSELKKNGVLGTKTILSKDDVVFFDIIQPKKQLPHS